MITCNYLIQKRTNCYFLISHQNRIIGRCRRRFSAATSTNYSTNNRVTVAIDCTGVCRVELNRPNKLNSLDMKMFDDIAETVSSLKSDRSIRAVILSGQGRAFCTGLDVKAVMKDGNPQIQIGLL